MSEILSELFKNLPPEIATFLIGMTPVGELRAAIPIGVSVYKLSLTTAFVFAVLGNVLSVAIILFTLEPISKFLIRNFKIFERFFDWIFKYSRKKHTKKFDKWGSLALIVLVAIPLPMTGGWTGALAAYVFGIKFKKAFPLITIGILIAGVIVTATVAGIFSFF